LSDFPHRHIYTSDAVPVLVWLACGER